MYKQIGYFFIITSLLFAMFFTILAQGEEPISILKRKQALMDTLTEQLKNRVPTNIRPNLTTQKGPKNVIKINSANSAINNKPKTILPTELEQATESSSEGPKLLTPKFAQTTSTVAKIEQNLSRTTITFLWDQPVKAAAFINNGKLWIIFDKFSNIQFIDNTQQFLNPKNQDYIKISNMMQRKIDNNNTFIVSDVKLPEEIESTIIAAYKQDNSWIIEVAHRFEKLKSIKVNAKFNNIYPYLTIRTGERFYGTIDFVDPFTHQNISIIPLYNSNVATLIKREFIDLNILDTIQGVVIEKISDGVIFNPLGNKSFSITKKSGLNIAPEIYLAQHDNLSYNLMRSSEKAILNPKYFQSGKESFINTEDKLIKKIITAKPSFKSRARLELTMFYLAHGFYNEAKAVLNLARKEDKMLNKKYQVITLLAALEFFTRNHQKALYEIQNFDIEDVPTIHREEFRFWQSLISYSNAENYQYVALSNTLRVFTNLNNNFLQYYTDQMLAEIGFITFEYKIQNNSLEDAYKILNVMNKFYYSDEISRNRLNYDIARYYLADHDTKNALDYFDRCLEGFDDNLHYNRCHYYRALMLRKSNMISEEQLIEILERVRLRWKGDNFEIRVSKKLYEIYTTTNRIIEALRVGQSILNNYPASLEAVQMSNNMSKSFIRFFLEKDNNHNDPIQALEIFFEFQHLLPIGIIGDEIILRVADYLDELDLLDRYIVLLEHQVKNRLTGFKKERAINKLASAYIKNLQPVNAINIMNFKSPNFHLPEFMERERKYIVAKALQKLGKDKDVLTLLKDDISHQSDEIKSEIFWQKKDWSSFNDFSEPYIYSIRNKEFTLNAKEVERILKQMISYLNLREYELLEALYEDFKPRIPTNDKYYKSIQLLSNISKVQKIKDKNKLVFDVDEIHQLTSEMINSLNNSI
ncbi:MAG: hypothetical protein MRQ07_00935 [Candidatus Midichloria sp.]|nr:hypothetical protein [Candidatus Midichloria sp.]